MKKRRNRHKQKGLDTIGSPLGFTINKGLSCPVCSDNLGFSYMGMNSHLLAHVRRKEITIERKVEIMAELYGGPKQ